jgi:signal transduction histidine kinase
MKRLGITGKLVVHSAWILIGLGVTVTAYSVSQLRQLLYQEMVRRVEAQTLNWIEANTSQIILSDSPQILNRLVSELKKREGIAYVILLNHDGKQRTDVGVPPELIAEEPSAREALSTTRWTNMKDAHGLRYFELATPISASGTGMSTDLETMFGIAANRKAWGDVRVGVDRQEYDRRLRALMWRNIALGAVLVLLAVAASFIFANRMVRPISAMGRAANQIASGKLSERVSRGSELHDEVGDLVRNFNQMARRLESLHSGLEDEVKQRTFELEGANQKLRELDKLKSYFVSIVSHDLRTPLTSIKAFAEILSDERNPDPGKRKHYLEIINKESDRMTRLISDLLSLEKINSGTFDWRMGRTNLEEIIRESEELMIPQAKEKGIELHVTELHCPPVWGDPDCLERVVTNLIGNAIKFSPQGGRVEVQLEPVLTGGPQDGLQGSYVRVVVADNGPGIPQEDQKRLFEPYYQPPKHSRVGSGVGLGLAICREIVSHHKGEIWVESELGAGSRFSFTVPLHQPTSL